MLEVKGITAHYGAHCALQDASLQVGSGEIVVMLGANGAGKTTLLKAIAGIVPVAGGASVRLTGKSLENLEAHERVAAGIALVPEGRGIFAELTVRDNLMLGAYTPHARGDYRARFERIVALFPRLQERLSQSVRTMSGGEQQMVAIGRALMSQPKVLMLDEPSLGLSPLLSKELFKAIAQIRTTGVSVLLVEQNVRLGLGVADRGYLISNGRVSEGASASALQNDPVVQRAYLGGV